MQCVIINLYRSPAVVGSQGGNTGRCVHCLAADGLESYGLINPIQLISHTRLMDCGDRETRVDVLTLDPLEAGVVTGTAQGIYMV